MKNKLIYLKFFGFTIFCGLLGGLSSIFFMKNEGIFFNIVENAQQGLLKYTLPITAIITVLLSLIAVILYLKSKICYRQLQLNEDDTLYDKIDLYCDIGTTLSNIILIFNFISFGISTSNMYFYDSNNQVIFGICFFVGAMAFCTMMMVLFINFTKKINPEKKGHPLDFNFQKKWLNSSDEAEKYIIYKASFKAFQTMQITFLILFMIFLLLSVILPIGPLPFIIIGILWTIQTVVYSVYTTKYQCNRKLKK